MRHSLIPVRVEPPSNEGGEAPVLGHGRVGNAASVGPQPIVRDAQVSLWTAILGRAPYNLVP